MAAAALAALLARPIAHRGLHAGPRGGGPVENTRAAAEAAVAAGYNIECDVQRSRDGEAMVIHDDALHRLTGIDARVGAMDAADIAALRLRDGSRIPTLAAFLARVAGRAAVAIEIKGSDPALAERVCAVFAGKDGPVALECFDAGIVAGLAASPWPIGLVGPADDVEEPALPERCDFLSWRIDRLAAAVARHPGMPFTTWTVRDGDQRAVAARCGAQIVFEGFRP